MPRQGLAAGRRQLLGASLLVAGHTARQASGHHPAGAVEAAHASSMPHCDTRQRVGHTAPSSVMAQAHRMRCSARGALCTAPSIAAPFANECTHTRLNRCPSPRRPPTGAPAAAMPSSAAPRECAQTARRRHARPSTARASPALRWLAPEHRHAPVGTAVELVTGASRAACRRTLGRHPHALRAPAPKSGPHLIRAPVGLSGAPVGSTKCPLLVPSTEPYPPCRGTEPPLPGGLLEPMRRDARMA